MEAGSEGGEGKSEPDELYAAEVASLSNGCDLISHGRSSILSPYRPVNLCSPPPHPYRHHLLLLLFLPVPPHRCAVSASRRDGVLVYTHTSISSITREVATFLPPSLSFSPSRRSYHPITFFLISFFIVRHGSL